MNGSVNLLITNPPGPRSAECWLLLIILSGLTNILIPSGCSFVFHYSLLIGVDKALVTGVSEKNQGLVRNKNSAFGFLLNLLVFSAEIPPFLILRSSPPVPIIPSLLSSSSLPPSLSTTLIYSPWVPLKSLPWSILLLTRSLNASLAAARPSTSIPLAMWSTGWSSSGSFTGRELLSQSTLFHYLSGSSPHGFNM